MQPSVWAPGQASGKTYDVFISHAGPQKETFAGWLQRELGRHGVCAFLDETSLRLGDAADAEMEAALRSCSIVVLVLTPDFLRSSYCMQELHWALHPDQLHPPSPQNTAKQQAAASSSPKQQAQRHVNVPQRSKAPTLLPVFYHTSDIDALQREIEQQTAEAYRKDASSAELQRLQQASSDLAAVLRINGDRQDMHGKLDREHVDAVVAEALRRLDRPRFKAPKYAVDLEARVKALLPLLQPDQPGDVRVLSLYGMGGIGKTTLAKALYSHLSSSSLRFNTRVFLEVGQNVLLEAKQQRLLQLLTYSPTVEPAGSSTDLQQRLEQCAKHGGPLLLALDDIWTVAQRNALLPGLEVLPSGSRVILTGRDRSHLYADDIQSGCAARPVEGLAAAEAEQLLCKHAFRQDTVLSGYAAAVQQALDVCAGLPLALQVVGAGMRSCTPAEAEAIQDGFRHTLAQTDGDTGPADATGNPLNVLAILKKSYDNLPSDEHRGLFLDAALLMRGHPREHLLDTWAGILQQEEEEYGVLRPTSLALLRGSAERLWSACAGATLVTCRTIDREYYSRVEVHDCMVEVAQSIRQDRPASWSLSSLALTTKLPQVATARAQASRLRCGLPGVSGVPPWTLTQVLSRHQQCRLAAVDLPLGGAVADAAPLCMPEQLLYLRLAAVPHQWAFGEQLVVLDVSGDSGCGFDLPASITGCSSLRHLRLSGQPLRSLPASMGSLGGLEALLLRNCTSLAGLPNSFSRLHQLQILDLAGCGGVAELPADVGSLSNLKVLDLSFCTALQQLPDSISRLNKLQRLGCRCCSLLEHLPAGIGSLSSLKWLDLGKCAALLQLPDSVTCLASLDTLYVDYCPALAALPDCIGNLANLEALDTSYCEALERLPASITCLSKLETLFIAGCCALEALPDSIGSLCRMQTLCMGGCSVLQPLPLSIGSLSNLESLDCTNCIAVQHLPDSIGSLSQLTELNVSWCDGVTHLPDTICSLSRLQTLDVSGCMALQQLPAAIGSLGSLKALHASWCIGLNQLPDSIGSLSSLTMLDTSHCTSLQLPDSIGSLPSLKMLDASHCTSLQLPDSIGSITSLRTLDIRESAAARDALPISIGILFSLRELEARAAEQSAALQQRPMGQARLLLLYTPDLL